MNRLLSASVTYYNTPSEVPTGWTTSVYAQGRIGRIGTATFEGDIGRTSSAPVQSLNFPTGQDWVSGQSKAFSLTVDSTGKATWRITGATRMSPSTPAGQTVPDFVEYTGTFIGTDLRLYAKSSLDTQVVTLSNLSLTDSQNQTLISGLTLSTNGTAANYQALWLADPALSSGFTLTGNATFTWAGTRPTNSNMHFQVTTGNWATVTSVTSEGAIASEARDGDVKPAIFRIERTGNTDGPLSVNFAVSRNVDNPLTINLADTGIADFDFGDFERDYFLATDEAGTDRISLDALGNATVTIEANESYARVYVIPHRDQDGDGNPLVEVDESITLTLKQTPSAAINANAKTASATLYDVPTISVEAETEYAIEGGTPGAFRLIRTGDLVGSIEVFLSVSGTAVRDESSGVPGNLDYDSIPSSVVFTDWNSEKILVHAVQDNVEEGMETVIVTLATENSYSTYQIISSAAIAVVNIEESPVAPAGILGLDVDGNGLLDDVVDGFANFLPGYRGTEQILTATSPQIVFLIVSGVDPFQELNIELLEVSENPGVAVNDFGLLELPPEAANKDIWFVGENPTHVNLLADGNGKAVIPVKVADFAAQAKVQVTNGEGVVLDEKDFVTDGDGDGLPDKWEELYSQGSTTIPTDFKPFDKKKANSTGVAGGSDAKRDDDANRYNSNDLNRRMKKGGEWGDRLTAFEEYRGFMIEGRHTRTNPAVKDLFISWREGYDRDPFLTSPESVPEADRTQTAAGLWSEPIQASPKIIGGFETNGLYLEDLDVNAHFINSGEYISDAKVNAYRDLNITTPEASLFDGIRQKVAVLSANATYVGSLYGTAGGDRTNYNGPVGPNGILPLPADYKPSSDANKPHISINLLNIRSIMATVDTDGSRSSFASNHYFPLGLKWGKVADLNDVNAVSKGFADQSILLEDAVQNRFPLYKFRAEDRVVWSDRDQSGHMSKGDLLWIDSEDAAGTGKYNQGEKVIYADGGGINEGIQGKVLDANSDFRFLKITALEPDKDNKNYRGYSDGDWIYTVRFDRLRYQEVLNHSLAHELGHAVWLQHDPPKDIKNSIMIGSSNMLAAGLTEYLDSTGKLVSGKTASRYFSQWQKEQLRLR